MMGCLSRRAGSLDARRGIISAPPATTDKFSESAQPCKGKYTRLSAAASMVAEAPVDSVPMTCAAAAPLKKAPDVRAARRDGHAPR